MYSDPVSLLDRRRRISGIASNNRIDGLGILHQVMAEKWDLLEDLMEGTSAMRLRGERWLPKYEKETQRQYEERLARSFLFDAFKDVITGLGAKPFSQACVVKEGESLSDTMAAIEDNVDHSGTSLTEWTADVFKTALQYGLTHALIDFPQNDRVIRGEDVNGRESDPLRPRFIHVRPRELIGWDSERDEQTGRQKLTRIRILTEDVEPYLEWGDQVVQYITVYTTTDVQRFRKSEQDKDFLPVSDPVPHTFGRVPLLTLYTNKTGFMTADPPFEGLADLNLQHWQVASDFGNIMKIMRFAILFMKGVPEDRYKTITIGPQTIIKTELADADMKYVEHSGAATGAGMEDIRNIEERMERKGVSPVIRQQGNMTATASGINSERSSTQLQKWVEVAERFMTLCYLWGAAWIGEKLPEGFGIEIFKDFDIILQGSEDVAHLLAATEKKFITKRVNAQEMQKRGLISESVDIDDMLEEIEAEEAEMLATMQKMTGGTSEDDDDEEDGDEGQDAAGKPARVGGFQRGGNGQS